MTITDATIATTALYDSLFHESLGHSDDRVVLIDAENPEHSYTRGDIKSKIRTLASKIDVIWPTLKVGDVVAQCSPNDIDLIVADQGLIYAGATVAIIDYARNDEEALVRDLKTANARYILTHPKALEKVLNAAEQLDIPKTNILLCGNSSIQGIHCLTPLFEGKEVEKESSTVVRRNIRDPLFLLFTSGTTGVNKAVMISYENIVHQCKHMTRQEQHNESPHLKYINFSQLHHNTGTLLTLINSLFNAKPSYIMEKFDFQTFCTYVERYKCTATYMVPYTASCIIRDPIVKNYDLSSLKGITVLGEHPDPSLIQDFKEKFGIDLLDLYGMTEVSVPFECRIENTKNGAIGKPSDDILVKLVDHHGKEAREGELRVKGPNVTPGYYNNEVANKAAFDDEGYFCTGDIFKVDEQGIFSFISRKKELITYGEYTMYPSEVESLVIQAPDVSNCAVVGIYDKLECTEMLTAFVERVKTVEDCEADEKSTISIAQGVMDHVNSLVDSNAAEDCFRLRGGVLVVDSLPHNNIGKVVRAKFRENAGTFRHAYFP